jgi:hypothetical protein
LVNRPVGPLLTGGPTGRFTFPLAERPVKYTLKQGARIALPDQDDFNGSKGR